MAGIVFSPAAFLDPKEIVIFIKRDSLRYALVERRKIVAAIEKLDIYPLMGKVFSKTKNENIRELILKIIE